MQWNYHEHYFYSKRFCHYGNTRGTDERPSLFVFCTSIFEFCFTFCFRMGKSFSIFGETVVANMLISGSFGLVSGLVETCPD